MVLLINQASTLLFPDWFFLFSFVCVDRCLIPAGLMTVDPPPGRSWDCIETWEYHMENEMEALDTYTHMCMFTCTGI